MINDDILIPDCAIADARHNGKFIIAATNDAAK